MCSPAAGKQANEHRDRNDGNKPNFVMLITVVHSQTSVGDVLRIVEASIADSDEPSKRLSDKTLPEAQARA
jgi:hypothetical protein